VCLGFKKSPITVEVHERMQNNLRTKFHKHIVSHVRLSVSEVCQLLSQQITADESINTICELRRMNIMPYETFDVLSKIFDSHLEKDGMVNETLKILAFLIATSDIANVTKSSLIESLCKDVDNLYMCVIKYVFLYTKTGCSSLHYNQGMFLPGNDDCNIGIAYLLYQLSALIPDSSIPEVIRCIRSLQLKLVLPNPRVELNLLNLLMSCSTDKCTAADDHRRNILMELATFPEFETINYMQFKNAFDNPILYHTTIERIEFEAMVAEYNRMVACGLICPSSRLLNIDAFREHVNGGSAAFYNSYTLRKIRVQIATSSVDESIPVHDLGRGCKICMERCAKTIIVDCGHIYMCLSCSFKVEKLSIEQRKCAICRSEITHIREVFDVTKQ
jgi:hypothetical protein